MQNIVETHYAAQLVEQIIEISARRLFLATFPIWLSDLHIGRIIVLKGANLLQFQNESERHWALIKVNERDAVKGNTLKFYSMLTHCRHRIRCFLFVRLQILVLEQWIGSVMAPKPKRPADDADDSTPLLLSSSFAHQRWWYVYSSGR